MVQDDTSLRDTVLAVFLIGMIIVFCFLSVCSCSQEVKPETSVDANVKTSLKNQQEMTEKINTLNGDMVKVQETLSVVETNITTQIDQKFETLQDSTKTGDVEGDVNASKSTNSALYGIGLVSVVLFFVLVLIWMMSKLGIKIATRIIK